MWTDIPKPTWTLYVNVNTAKPSYDEPTLSYDDPSIFYDGFNPNQYTDISKPGIQSYVNITKPI